jgi:hypothetical protein
MSNVGILELTPSEVYEFVTDALKARQVPYVAGPPAIGKSQIVHAVAKDFNLKMIDLRLSQMLSEDMTGLPEKDEKRGKAIYLPFDTFPLEGDEIPDGYAGWLLFLDELSSASEEVLAAAYSVLLDRTVGGKRIHDNCLIVAAGNRASDSAIARELPDTLITRMLPCNMTVNSKDWTKWAKKFPGSNESIIEFIRKSPAMLYSPVKAKERDELETYPTPRGWEKAFAFVNQHEARAAKQNTQQTDSAGIPVDSNPDNTPSLPLTDMCFNLISACVGTAAARTFREDYDEQVSLPYPWEIAQSPSSTRIPSTTVGKVKVIGQLADYFVKSDNQARDSVLTYVNRIGGEHSELFAKEVKDKLGTTSSDLDLIQDIEERLGLMPF